MNKIYKIAIVIPVYNRKEMTLNCLRLLEYIDKEGMDITVVVVDDASTDGTSKAIEEEYPETIILHGDGNLWWSGSTNLGVEYSLDHDSDYVLTLNNDVDFKPDFLRYLLETAKSNTNIISCAAICDLDNRDRIVSAGRYAKGFLGYNYSGHLTGEDISKLPAEDYESDIESGYAMLIDTRIFKEIGLFDSKTFPQNMGDMDFVLRAKKTGSRVLVNPRAILFAKRSSNYFHTQIVENSTLSVLNDFVQLKSTVNLKIRWYFCWRHTPYYLGWLSYSYFVVRMLCAIILKIILPAETLRKIIKKRKRI